MVAEGKKKDLFLSIVFNYIETMFYYNYNGLKLVVHSEIMQTDKAVRALYSQLLAGVFYNFLQPSTVSIHLLVCCWQHWSLSAMVMGPTDYMMCETIE